MQRFTSFIGGEWISGGNLNLDENPSDLSSPVGEVLFAGATEVERAADAAVRAQKSWRDAPLEFRANVLDRIAVLLAERANDLGRLLSVEQGKVLAEGVAEVIRASNIFKFFSAEVVRLSGQIFPSVREGVQIEILREPVGVVGVIAPWNFPIAIPAWKIAPALAYGNAVVFKPSEYTPAIAVELVKICVEAGLPHGLLNLVIGDGPGVGEAILTHPSIEAVTFTGSVATGRFVAAKAIERMAKVQCELGGKNPLVILDDANLEVAVNVALNGTYFGAGQRCTSSSRIIVTEKIYDAFVKAFVNRVAALRVGHALGDNVDIGPIVSSRQLAQDVRYIEIGKSEGAQLVCGGELLERETRGYYLTPAVFTNVNNEMRIAREEIFGPVAGVIRAGDYDEALHIANDTKFGLSSGICTTSLRYATDFKAKSQAGLVMVNLPTGGVEYHVPFGGAKDSAYGPGEQGSYAKEFYTNLKTTYTMA